VSRLQRRVYATWNGGATSALGRASPARNDTRYAALPQALPTDDADAFARRGAAALAAGNHASALDDLNRACELAPGVADYFDSRARLHLAMRQTRLALADLDQALTLNPALAEARMRRARVHAALKQRPSAQADLDRLDADLPPSAALRADMGRLYAGFALVAPALRQFGLWIDSHPRDARLADALNERCWLRARLNIELPLALEDCKRAVDLDEEAQAPRDSLGWTYLRLGDAARARTAFDGAIRLQARAMSLYGRALASFQLDDPASAAQDLAAARKLQPSIQSDARRQGLDFIIDPAPPGGPQPASAAGS
jgi:tetratricopeptide (TPR) repeat protein